MLQSNVIFNMMSPMNATTNNNTGTNFVMTHITPQKPREERKEATPPSETKTTPILTPVAKKRKSPSSSPVSSPSTSPSSPPSPSLHDVSASSPSTTSLSSPASLSFSPPTLSRFHTLQLVSAADRDYEKRAFVPVKLRKVEMA